MHELELQPVGIGKEQSVVSVAIVRVVAGWIENGGADADQQLVEAIDVLAGARDPGQVVQAAGIAVMAAIASRQPDGERGSAMRRTHVPVDPCRGRAAATIAEKSQDSIVEGGGTREVR